ncbi:MAG TPA: coagulation factor 5/8 type domain-containing protein, partial [Polyangiaceae bacterium]
TPGIYHLDESLQITAPGTIVFGLGLPTLIPNKGTPALSIADVDGVDIAGLIVDAGPISSSTLLQVGPPGSNASHAQNPSALHDVFCRIGGGSPGSAASCVTINSNDVLGDDLWLWRADHGMGVGWTSNVSKNGLIVNGNDVTMYGLFVEHFQEYQVLWNGNAGRTFFYQSELPYDPPNQAAWQHDTVNGYASYKVAATVTSHTASGVGIYCAFRSAVVSDNAIEAPSGAGIVMHHLMTSWLNGTAGSAINHIINGTGGSATTGTRQALSAD